MRLVIPEISIRTPASSDLSFMNEQNINYDQSPIFDVITITEQTVHLSNENAETLMDIIHMFSEDELWLKRVDKENYILFVKEVVTAN